MSIGQTATLALELIEEKLKAAQYATDQLAYTEINRGTLTSEKAMSYWFKKQALYELHTRLMGEVRAGQSSAAKAAELMEADIG